MSVTWSGSSNPSLAAALSAAVDMDAALNQQDNLALMWHLLYDPNWQVRPHCLWFVASSLDALAALWARAELPLHPLVLPAFLCSCPLPGWMLPGATPWGRLTACARGRQNPRTLPAASSWHSWFGSG